MFLGLFPEWKKNPKKVEDYLKKLRAQDPIKGEAQEPLNRLSSGECLIGATPLIRGLPAIKQGAPFALAPISPTYGLSVVVTVPKGSPNPNGAKLLAAWLAGPQGTAELLKIGRGVLGPPQLALSEQAKLLANSGVAYQGVTTLEDIKLMSGPYADKLSQIMGWPK